MEALAEVENADVDHLDLLEPTETPEPTERTELLDKTADPVPTVRLPILKALQQQTLPSATGNVLQVLPAHQDRPGTKDQGDILERPENQELQASLETREDLEKKVLQVHQVIQDVQDHVERTESFLMVTPQRVLQAVKERWVHQDRRVLQGRRGRTARPARRVLQETKEIQDLTESRDPQDPRVQTEMVAPRVDAIIAHHQGHHLGIDPFIHIWDVIIRAILVINALSI